VLLIYLILSSVPQRRSDNGGFSFSTPNVPPSASGLKLKDVDTEAVCRERDVLRSRVEWLSRMLQEQQDAGETAHPVEGSPRGRRETKQELYTQQLERTQASLEEARILASQLAAQLELKSRQLAEVTAEKDALMKTLSSVRDEMAAATAAAAARGEALERQAEGRRAAEAHRDRLLDALEEAEGGSAVLLKRLNTQEQEKDRQVEDLVKLLLKSQAEAREGQAALAELQSVLKEREAGWTTEIQAAAMVQGSVSSELGAAQAQLAHAHKKLANALDEKAQLAAQAANEGRRREAEEAKRQDVERQLSRAVERKKGKSKELLMFYEQTELLMSQMATLEAERAAALEEKAAALEDAHKSASRLQQQDLKLAEVQAAVETSHRQVAAQERQLAEARAEAARLGEEFKAKMAAQQETAALARRKQAEAFTETLDKRKQMLAEAEGRAEAALLEAEKAGAAAAQMERALHKAQGDLTLQATRHQDLEGACAATIEREGVLRAELAASTQSEAVLRGQMAAAGAQAALSAAAAEEATRKAHTLEAELSKARGQGMELDARLEEAAAVARVCDSGNVGRDSGNVGRDSGNVGRDSGNVGPDSGNVGHDSGIICRATGVLRPPAAGRERHPARGVELHARHAGTSPGRRTNGGGPRARSRHAGRVEPAAEERDAPPHRRAGRAPLRLVRPRQQQRPTNHSPSIGIYCAVRPITAPQ
jgi:chromosome segregation ATPase